MPSTLLVCLICLLSIINYCHSLPVSSIESKLFDPIDYGSEGGPEIPLPPLMDSGSGDLQKNSARLHRTLFLLDTSDLLKKAGLFGASKLAAAIVENSVPTERSSRSLFRLRREAKSSSPDSGSAKYATIIKVRKPFLSVDEEDPFKQMVTV